MIDIQRNHSIDNISGLLNYLYDYRAYLSMVEYGGH